MARCGPLYLEWASRRASYSILVFINIRLNFTIKDQEFDFKPHYVLYIARHFCIHAKITKIWSNCLVSRPENHTLRRCVFFNSLGSWKNLATWLLFQNSAVVLKTFLNHDLTLLNIVISPTSTNFVNNFLIVLSAKLVNV